MNRTMTTVLCATTVLCGYLPAQEQAGVIGQVKNVVPSTIWVSPEGEHVLAVTVDSKTQK